MYYYFYRQLPKVDLSLQTQAEHLVFYSGDVRAFKCTGGSVLGLVLDQSVIGTSSHLHR